MEYTNIERIIAKIDNDFNPNNSDWIPRVGAWVHDALSQLGVTQEETKTLQLPVVNNIARATCYLPNDVKLYDSRGCEIKEYDANKCGCKQDGINAPTGEVDKTPQTITTEISCRSNINKAIAFTRQTKDYPARYNVVEIDDNKDNNKYYFRTGSNIFELNYDGEPNITVSYKAPKTYYCAMYNCNLPVIPDNGKLIEAITYYCLYKMLCRGYKHPVFNLSASQYGTNPYYIWTTTKDEAMRSVMNEGTDEDLSKLWQSAFFIQTFH